jgi:hypothetical protein
MIEMNEKLIKAINSWENDYLNCTDDELSTIVNAARSTLTPPQSDTQGALDDYNQGVEDTKKAISEKIKEMALYFDRWECYSGKYASSTERESVDPDGLAEIVTDVSVERALSSPSRGAKLLQILKDIQDCPYSIDLDTVPKGGVDVAPQQVVLNVSMSLLKMRAVNQAIAEAEGE